MSDPIDNVTWVHARKLWANAWNPNVVFNQELKLLEENILTIGYVQPILVNPDHMIIDGFHRVGLALTSKKLIERYAEEVPIVVLDMSIPEAMMLTVRMNRAKGKHIAFKMSDMVKTLVEDYGVTPEDMVKKMGMTKSEVELLSDGSLIKRRDLEDREYSRAWVPIETKHLSAEELAKFKKSRQP